MTDAVERAEVPGRPIACSLAGAERADRARWLKRLNEQALRVLSRPDGVRVEFPCHSDLEAEARALAEAEARCCPFLTLEVSRNGDRIDLVVTGPPEARPIIEDLFAVRS